MAGSGATDRPDIAIVGGGAAGLAAAVFAAERARELGRTAVVVVLDGASPIGSKILVSGGGRCNVTHASVTADDYNGPRPFVRSVLAAFDADAARAWFASLGVPLKTEATGKLFPVTDRASTVLDALLGRCARLGVEVREGCRVSGVSRVSRAPGVPGSASGGVEDAPGFVVEHARGRLVARVVILATGGRSLPRSGSDGSGWDLARALGHTVATPFPALVPLCVAEGFFHARLAGVTHEVELATVVGGKVVDRRSGSLLWTHFGVSGPVVLDASRHWIAAALAGKATSDAGKAPVLRCAVLPGRSPEALDEWLVSLARTAARRSISRVLAESMPERVARALCGHATVPADRRMAELSRAERRALVPALSGLALPVVGHRGWDRAEVTAGGVPLADVDRRTMESRMVPGLYLAGEMLDCDGRIGGFNFHWAWATGYLAGRAAASA